MKLTSFRVQDYRSINDSGIIDVSRITALLGRNESGKSNLLLALQTLNPAEGFSALNKIKDFPRHRRLEECNSYTTVVTTWWEFTEEEKAELAGIFPRASSVSNVSIERWYGQTRIAEFQNLPPLSFDAKDIKAKVRRIIPVIKARAEKLAESERNALEASLTSFEENVEPDNDAESWAEAAVPALETMRKALASADVELTEAQEQNFTTLEELAEEISGDKEAYRRARSWAVEKLPIFMYLEDYPDLSGHQNIAEHLQRKAQQTSTPFDKNFDKLCKVAGLKPQQLNDLLDEGKQEERNQLANRAGAVVTTEIRRLWKDRALKVRFNLDGQHLDTFISDPNAIYDVEVNFDERSRGFKWFFSFYISFSADTNSGEAEDAILLLDEPGLYLHARSQGDLLNHFEKDFKNQIIYTTHSPFMVPTHNLASVRTVNIAEEAGTTVSNDPTGDRRTLFPLQAALGYDLAQSLFIGPNNLVLEGVTDYWILSSVSDYMAEQGFKGLSKDLTLTPAGGAQKIPYMVALLTSEQLNTFVLMDEEKDARATRDDLVKAKLIRDTNVIFVSDAFDENRPGEADIEDLLDAATYIELVKKSYAKELKSKTLKLNDKIPRIAKRVETALNDLGIEFFKTRPTRLLLDQMASKPESIVTTDAKERFETLFGVINERFEAHLKADRSSFR